MPTGSRRGRTRPCPGARPSRARSRSCRCRASRPEIAFHLPRSGALIVGDLVIGVPPGELSTYPDEVVDDRAELQRSAARLLDYDFDALLLCDGQPLASGGKDKLRAFVESETA